MNNQKVMRKIEQTNVVLKESLNENQINNFITICI